MKKSEIGAGRIYTNGKGRYRLVIALGAEYILYSGQAEQDCLCYRGAVEQKRGMVSTPKENSTRAAFAAWAKDEIVDLSPELRQQLMMST